MTADGVDAVYVVTTHDSHYEYAKLALECGKPVLVEKPFTMTAAEAKELVALAKKKGLIYPFETLKDGIIRTL
ncbi:MAG: Gfo/Idh/MocA family oxidoreductase, partial [Acutalibacteraceae bacterium]|nr:Gfo/Idh/MocA family oxidoreductase [Acutalibacteraceae bacterium]